MTRLPYKINDTKSDAEITREYKEQMNSTDLSDVEFQHPHVSHGWVKEIPGVVGVAILVAVIIYSCRIGG